MDHVGPVLAQNVCDFPREEQIFVGFATAISGIFIWKETKLLDNSDVLYGPWSSKPSKKLKSFKTLLKSFWAYLEPK